MQKTARKNSYQEGTSPLPQHKVDFSYQKEYQDRAPKEQKASLNREAEVTSLLTADKAIESLKNLDGWQLTDDHKMLYREFIVHDFMAAIGLIDRIAVIAESEKHHPDIHLTKYRNLRIGLTTHDVGGLSEKDFTVALKIKNLPILSNKATSKPEHKDKSVQIPKHVKMEVHPKKKKIISAVLKKGKNVKTSH